MYVSVPASELTLAWYIKLLARQLPLSGHSFLLQLHVDWSVTCVLFFYFLVGDNIPDVTHAAVAKLNGVAIKDLV